MDQESEIASQLEEQHRRLRLLEEQFRAIREDLGRIERKLDYTISKTEFRVLPGTPYSKYLLPIEYLPSRAYQPRWGNTHPPIERIQQLIELYLDDYRAHLRLMRQLAPQLADVPLHWDPAAQPQPCWAGTPLNAFDSLLVYSMLAQHKPSLYLEIGSGISTLFANRAKRDLSLDMQIWSLDPEPRSEIDAVCDRTMRYGLEEVDLSVFAQLTAGDVLFFDGSHRSFTNSDVTVFMIDVLPNLKPGVIVHIHDIGLPTDYAGFVLDWYWNEQYLLAAYILGGARIRPLMPASFISQRPDLFPEHAANPVLLDLSEWNSWAGGGSFWFTHLAPPVDVSR